MPIALEGICIVLLLGYVKDIGILLECPILELPPGGM
jgi:hypothetical protein